MEETYKGFYEMDEMDDTIKDEINVSSYQDKEAIDNNKENDFDDNDPNLGTYMSKDIYRCIIKSHIHVQMTKVQRKEIRYI